MKDDFLHFETAKLGQGGNRKDHDKKLYQESNK